MRTPLAIALGALAPAALAQVTNPANGHTYLLTDYPMSWAQAQATAAAMGGNLATFTDPAEHYWVLANVPFGDEFEVWLGARDYGEAQWTWVTREPLTFTMWFVPPPLLPPESYLTLMTSGSERGSWWALTPAWQVRGLIEIGPVCYPNCDNGTTAPALSVADFTCFLQKFASGNWYANCDESTVSPIFNIADFTCYLQRFAAGCSVP